MRWQAGILLVSPKSNHTTAMLKNYIKIAWRSLINNKVYSGINILGLAAGMAVTLLIALWIRDELNFNSYFRNYSRLAQIMTVQTINGKSEVEEVVSIPLSNELSARYPEFKQTALASGNGDHILAYKNKKVSQPGMWVQRSFPSLFSLNLLKGDPAALNDPSSILLAKSLAYLLFGNTDPINKIIRLDNKMEMKVAGIYEDLPRNTTFYNTKCLLPWDKYITAEEWIKKGALQWDNHSFLLFAQLNDHVDPGKVNERIKSIPTAHIKGLKEEIMLYPMNKWHLYSGFKDGKITGGRIQFVWMFGIIGIFVLLLACINFMNLSTARGEKRAREVGIRKSVGSLRIQLIVQFLGESVLIAFLALIFAILLLLLALPFFNNLADKEMNIPWRSPLFWLLTAGFTLFTGLISGSYPAFYLSGFKPLSVLKGTFRTGSLVSIPRKVLVVIQFSISVTLIIGTIIVFRQIQHAKSRPVGYSREGLITLEMNTPEISGHYNAIRNDLLQTGAVEDMAESSSEATHIYNNNNGFEWKGKDPHTEMMFRTMEITHDFGKTIGWEIKSGRNFSRKFSSDTGSVILNETAAKLTGLPDPVGEIIRWGGIPHTIVGVVKDMVTQSPYKSMEPTIFFLRYDRENYITIRINPSLPVREALAKIAPVFEKYNPASPFVYKFVDQEYGRKFHDEERLGNLATVLTLLAIFISCLGLFGLASFVAEQRTKEIGIRKVMGASVFQLWALLSKEFLLLVTIACCVAIPVAWYFLGHWLEDYEYHTSIAWWIFAISSVTALLIALITVSFHAIKAALMNPAMSLKTE